MSDAKPWLCDVCGKDKGTQAGSPHVCRGSDVSRFVVKDSGKRQDFPSGMRRDTQDGKTNFLLVRDGPMLRRWAEHMTKGADKYGLRNWTKACSEEELERFRTSAARHFEAWLNGEADEDHGAATMFNINAAEFVEERLAADRS